MQVNPWIPFGAMDLIHGVRKNESRALAVFEIFLHYPPHSLLMFDILHLPS